MSGLLWQIKQAIRMEIQSMYYGLCARVKNWGDNPPTKLNIYLNDQYAGTDTIYGNNWQAYEFWSSITILFTSTTYIKYHFN